MHACRLWRAAGRAIAAGAVCVVVSSAGAQTYDWTNALGGVWNSSSNWSPVGIPNSLAHTAVIDLTGTWFTVTLGGLSPTVDMLDIRNPQVALSIDDAFSLSVNDISNDGSIVVNGSGGASATSLVFLAGAGTLSGSGEIVLNATAGQLNRAYLYYDSGANVLTNGPQHTIRGSGNIYTNIANQGTISADRSGEYLNLHAVDKSNSGTIEGIGGGVLQISGIVVNQSGAGEVVADAGIVALVNGGRINAGVIRGINGGSVLVWEGHTAYLGTGPTVEGTLHVRDGATLRVLDNLVNDGVITVNPAGGASATALAFDAASSSLSGTGQIVLNATAGQLDRAYLYYDSGANVVTQAATHTIRGKGRIHTQINNLGLISADQNAEALQLLSTSKNNSGIVQAVGGGVLSIHGVGVNQTATGEVAADNGIVQLSGGGSISGGLIESTGTGVAQVANGDSASLTGVPTIEGPFHVRDGATLYVDSSVENNGTIAVNSDGGGSSTALNFRNPAPTFSGTGEIVLNATGTQLDRAYLYFDSAANVLTNGPQHTIRGRGNAHVRIDNQGLVSADMPGEYLQLVSTPKTNSARMEAVNGAILQINGVSVTQSGGEIVADSGEVRLANGASISGGSVRSINGGVTAVIEGNAGVLTGQPTLSGPTQVRDGGYLVVTSDVTNNGTMTVNPNNGASGTHIDFNATAQRLQGTGELVLNATGGQLDRAYLYFDSGANTLTNGPDHTIRGKGNVYVELHNEGLVSADANAEVLQMLWQPKFNSGLMRAVGGAVLQFNGVAVTQTGGQIVADAGEVLLIGGASVGGGDLNSVNGGAVAVQYGHLGQLLNATTLSGRFEVRDGGYLRVLGNIENNATLIVNPTGGVSGTHIDFNAASQTLSGTGELVLNATGGQLDRAYLYFDSGANDLVNAAGHTIAGNGNVYVHVINQGTISPGHSLTPGGEIGRLHLASQPMSFAPTGELVMQVSGTAGGQFDQVTGGAPFVCDGTVRLEHYGAFTSAPFGTRIPIIQTGSVTGQFDDLIADALPAPLYWKLDYSSNMVEAVVSCEADTTIDGIVDFFDVQNFLAIFSAGNPQSDINGDGVIDFFDVLMYLNLFSTGC